MADDVTLSLQLRRDAEPLAGLVTACDGHSYAFAGWMALVAAIEAAAERSWAALDAQATGRCLTALTPEQIEGESCP